MPTAHKGRRLALLVMLLVVLTGLVATSIMRRPTTDKMAVSSNSTTARSSVARNQDTVKNPEAVAIDALKMARPNPVEGERNPFRFRAGPTPPPRPTPIGGRSTGGPAPSPVGPTATAGPPPIVLKFIGIVDAPAQGGKLAVLSDGRSGVFYGHEGEVVDGRFKIVRIGVESLDIMYVDGRGRQTIRLSGQ